MGNKLSYAKRFVISNWTYLLIFFIIIVIGLIDSFQITTFHELNDPEAWALYTQYTFVSFIALWVLIIGTPVIVYYFFTKDLSETLGLFSAGMIMLAFGVEDVMYFVFSKIPMSNSMCWFNEWNAPVSWWSQLLGEQCVSAPALLSFAGIGVALSYIVFYYMRRYKK